MEANPLLSIAGRAGRLEVIRALRDDPTKSWGIRELAVATGIPPMAVSRAVRELAAVAAAETKRPGRQARVRWLANSPAGRWLGTLEAPDLRRAVLDTFAANLRHPARVVLWTKPGDDPGDPRVPTRIALLVQDGEEAALDASGAALDAVAGVALPAPDVAAFLEGDLDPADAVAKAILAGREASAAVSYIPAGGSRI
ncbi:MAG: hypothetical protein ACYDBQ_09835 [Thermoplasmatota archaeon]